LNTAIEVAAAFGDDVHVVVAYEVHRLGGEVADFAAALNERAQTLVKHATDQAAGSTPRSQPRSSSSARPTPSSRSPTASTHA